MASLRAPPKTTPCTAGSPFHSLKRSFICCSVSPLRFSGRSQIENPRLASRSISGELKPRPTGCRAFRVTGSQRIRPSRNGRTSGPNRTRAWGKRALAKEGFRKIKKVPNASPLATSSSAWASSGGMGPKAPPARVNKNCGPD